MPTDQKPTREEMEQAVRCFEASLAPSTLAEDGSMECRLYGGEQVVRKTWEGAMLLRLSLEPGAVDTARLDRGVTVTAGHVFNSDVLSSIGRTVEGTATVDKSGITARVALAAEKDVAPVFVPVVRQLRSGTLRDLSVQVGEWTLERAEDEDRDGMKAYVATKWEIASLAVVVAGASKTSTTLALEPGREPVAKEPTMERTPEQLAADNAARLEAEKTGEDRENARQRDIRALGAQTGCLDLANEYATDKAKSLADFQAAALASLVESQKATAAKLSNGNAHTSVSADEGDKAFAGIAEALAHKIDPECKPSDNGKRFSHLSASRLAAKFLGVHGVNVEPLSDRQIVERAMTRVSKSFAQTTSDFPSLIGAGFNRSLARGFAEAVRTFQPWTEAITVQDFEGFDVVGLDDVPALQSVPENGLYPLVNLSDKKESGNVTKSGNRILLSWEAILGDRLGAFQQIMNRQRYRALMLEETTAYGVLTTNANMRDGNPLFHANHANLAGAVIISPTTVGELLGFIAAQTDTNGSLLGLRGRYLVGGFGTMQKWEQYLSDAYKPTSSTNVVTTTQRGLVPIDSPASLGTKFFVIAEPMSGGTVTVARLAGYESPTVTVEEKTDTDSYEYKVRHVFGAKSAEWRTMAYNPGA